MERQPMRHRMREWFAGERRPALSGAHAASPATGSTAVLEHPSAPRPSREGAGTAAEKIDYLRQVADAADLVEHGIETTAIVLSRETSERRFNGAQIIAVQLEVEYEDGPRIVLYDHLFGPAAARRWRPGRAIPIWIDPRDPERIYAGR